MRGWKKIDKAIAPCYTSQVFVITSFVSYYNKFLDIDG